MKGRCSRLAYMALLAVASVMFTAQPVEAVSVKDEIKLGKEAAAEVEKEYPVTDNKQWLEEIDQLGKSLTPYVKRKEIPYSFKIIKERVDGKDEADAFSLPGGPVYFSEKMWTMLTHDERMGVLAHEIAHIDKRHAINTIGEMQRRGLWAAAILILTGADSSWWNASDLANQLYTLKFSRKREREADLMAVDLCRACGSNPAGIVTAMQKILWMEQEHNSMPLRILASHPDTEQRVTYLRQRCMAFGVKPNDCELPITDAKGRIGDVVETTKKGNFVTVTTIRPVAINEVLWIRKHIWDDDAGAIVCKTMARGVAITTGNRAIISVQMEPECRFKEIGPGDGVYQCTPQAVPPPPPPGTR